MKRITTAAVALALVGALAAPTSAAQAAPANITGTVEYHGTPVAGITVGWFSPDDLKWVAVASGTDGTYSLPLPDAGEEYVLFGNVTKVDGAQSRGNKNYVGVYYGAGNTRDYAYQTLDTYTAGTDADEVDIELAKPGTLTGNDENLTMAAHLETLGGTLVKRAYNPDGTLTFANLVPGQYRLAQPDSYGSGDVVTDEILTVTEGQTTTFDPEVQEGGTISGVVKGANGKPAGHMQFIIRSTAADPELDFDYQDETDGDGSYSVTGLQDSSYEIEFGRPAGLYPDKGWVPETVQVTGVTDGGTITHNETLATGGRIRALVKSSATTSSNEFTLVGPDGTTITPGAYQNVGTLNYGSLASGTYTLYQTNWKSSQYAKATVTVTAGATTHLGEFRRTTKGIAFRGDIFGLGSDKGKLKGALAILSAPDRPTYQDMTVSADGYYLFTGVAPGTYELEVRIPGRTTTTRSVTVSKSSVYGGITAGKKLGTVTASFTAGEAPVPDGYLVIAGNSGRALQGYIDEGEFLATAREGSYDTVEYLRTSTPFQGNSPYWVQLPGDALPITVTSAQTTDLGDVKLEVFPELAAD